MQLQITGGRDLGLTAEITTINLKDAMILKTKQYRKKAADLKRQEKTRCLEIDCLLCHKPIKFTRQGQKRKVNYHSSCNRIKNIMERQGLTYEQARHWYLSSYNK